METEDLAANVRRLAAEADVAKVILRYAQGLDRRNFDQVWACFHPDAHVKGTAFEGPLKTYLPRLLAGVRSYPRTMHFMGNQLREVDGDRAHTETYAIAHHFADAEGRQESLIMGVRYLDTLRRTPAGWLITAREVFSDWTRSPS